MVLFQRTRAGVRPSVAGEALLKTARGIQEDFQTMVANAWTAGCGDAGRLTIGFYSSLAGGNLRATVLDYTRRHPAVDLLVVEDSRARLLRGIKSGTIDRTGADPAR